MHTPKTKELIDSYIDKLFELAKHNADINRKLVDYPARVQSDEYDLILVDIFKPVSVFLQSNPVDLPIIKSVADHCSEFKIGKVLITDGHPPLELMAMGADSEELEDYQFHDEREKIDFENRNAIRKMFFDEAKKSQIIIYITTIEPYESCKGLVEIPKSNHTAGETEKILSNIIMSELNYEKFNPLLCNLEDHFYISSFDCTYHSLSKAERASISDLRPLGCAYPYVCQEPEEIYKQTYEILNIVSNNFMV